MSEAKQYAMNINDKEIAINLIIQYATSKHHKKTITDTKAFKQTENDNRMCVRLCLRNTATFRTMFMQYLIA